MPAAHAHAERNDTLLDRRGELLTDGAIELMAEASTKEVEALSCKEPHDEMDVVREILLSCVICTCLWLLMVAVWVV